MISHNYRFLLTHPTGHMIRVCKKAWLKTFGVGERKVSILKRKMSLMSSGCQPDMRGKYRRLPNPNKEMVRLFLYLLLTFKDHCSVFPFNLLKLNIHYGVELPLSVEF